MEKEAQKEMDLSESTELDNEVDILVEFKRTADVIDDEVEGLEAQIAKEKVKYLKFLISELEDALSGEYERLRYTRFITKRTPI
jgi:hypothetical protein